MTFKKFTIDGLRISFNGVNLTEGFDPDSDMACRPTLRSQAKVKKFLWFTVKDSRVTPTKIREV